MKRTFFAIRVCHVVVRRNTRPLERESGASLDVTETFLLALVGIIRFGRMIDR